jgi:UTP--glucose-1-phosphate uridylyltransferase
MVHVRQGQAKGLGHAVLCALPVIGKEPFVVVLPDVLIDEYKSDLNTENLAKMIEVYQDTKVSQIMVESIPKELVSNYGVVDLQGSEIKAGENMPIKAIIEKPDQEDAPSNLAVVGRYVLNEKIWELLKQPPRCR